MVDLSGSKFQFRAFISLVVTISFVAMAFSGVMMFLSPPGRIANWSGWKLIGLTKEQWISVHLSFSAVFLVSSLIHIWLNGRALLSYFCSRMKKVFLLRVELFIAAILCGILLWGTLAQIAPFNQVITLREKAKRIWDNSSQQAPIPHAELLTLAQVAEAAERDVATLRANLDSRQIQADWDTDLFGEVAQRNGMTPIELYNIAMGRAGQGRGFGGGQGRQSAGSSEDNAGTGGGGPGGGGLGGPRGSGSGFGGGYGRMTLQDICLSENIDLQTALDRLTKAGIQAQPEQTLRQIANTSGKRPSEVFDLIKVE
jgi:uncharacterized membrane protein YgcG